MKILTKNNPHLEWRGLPCKVPTMEHLDESQVSRVHYSQNLKYLACIILRISHYSAFMKFIRSQKSSTAGCLECSVGGERR